jgi:hypothetical protein
VVDSDGRVRDGLLERVRRAEKVPVHCVSPTVGLSLTADDSVGSAPLSETETDGVKDPVVNRRRRAEMVALDSVTVLEATKETVKVPLGEAVHAVTV